MDRCINMLDIHSLSIHRPQPQNMEQPIMIGDFKRTRHANIPFICENNYTIISLQRDRFRLYSASRRTKKVIKKLNLNNYL